MHADVEITGIAAGGAGVGRLPNGKAVFVHRTAPGELAEVRVLEEKRRWARAELVRLHRAAPGRREAPCPHYTHCGGCTLEHLEYEAQLRIKGEIVADALRRIGGLEIDVPEVTASPDEFRYRNRVSFTLRRLRGGRIVAGFHEVNRPGRIVDISESCMLPEPPIAEAWGRLRASWGSGADRLPAGRQLRLTLRGTAAGEVVLLIEGGRSRGRPEELIEVAGLAAVWRQRDDGALEHLAGATSVRERWRGEEVELDGAIFLQVNRSAAALLEAYVLDLANADDGTSASLGTDSTVGPSAHDARSEPPPTGEPDPMTVEAEAGEEGDRLEGGHRVIDAYSGIGLYARRLAREGADVVGVEVDERAVAEARKAAPEGARFVVGRVEERLAEVLPADLVILNPPRAGIDAAVPAALLDSPPERLIYVSCDPATLARDLERLAPRYRLRSLRCFDLFPQTSHIESVAELVCDTM